MDTDVGGAQPAVSPSPSNKNKWIWGGVGGAVGVGVILAIALPLALRDDPAPDPPYVDPILPHQLIPLFNSMNVTQKLGQLNQFTTSPVTGPDTTVPWEQTVKDGKCGSLFNVVDVVKANELQQTAIDSMGIPLLIGYDTIHGYKTIFPINLGLAASWDTDLVERSFAVAANETLNDGIQMAFSPMVDISRDSRWGRISESHGEDTFLSSRMAEAAVRGLQFNNVSTVLACVKHFAAYGGALAGKDYSEVDMSMDRLFNEYLPPYEAAVKAGAAGVMTSFNTLNGLPAAANPFLMQQILKEHWGFLGVVMTDYGAVMELTNHQIAADWEQAGVKALAAGTDMEMAAGVWYFYLEDALNKGLVSMSRIDDAVKRILRVKWDAGLFDDVGRAKNNGTDFTDPLLQQYQLTQDHLDTSTEAVEKTSVLLKNDAATLPYVGAGKILVVGSLADSKVDTLGNWHAMGEADDAKAAIVTLYAGLADKYTAANVVLQAGTQMDPEAADGDQDAAIAAVVAAITEGTYDMVITVFGESQNSSGESSSRSDLYPCCRQSDLIQAIRTQIDSLQTKPKHVGVLYSGRGMAIEKEVMAMDAVINAWFPGTMGGVGLSNLIHGDKNFAGKLSIAMPRNSGQGPIFYHRLPTGRGQDKTTDNEFVHTPDDGGKYFSRYIDVKTQPLFPFGYGLSYTTFTYGALTFPAGKQFNNPQQTFSVSVDVTNNGTVAGDEVVQLYIHDLAGSQSRPVRQLVGFTKVSLEAGAMETVQFDVKVNDFGFYKTDYTTAYESKLTWVVEPGKFEIFVGGSSEPDWDSASNTYPVVSGSTDIVEYVGSAPTAPSQPAGQDILPPELQTLFNSLTLDIKLGQLNLFSNNDDLTGPDESNIVWNETIIEGRCGSVINVNNVTQINELQQTAWDTMKIPLLVGYDSLHGYKTIFPVNLGLAATWDTELVKELFAIQANESLTDGIQQAFAPMVDISRDSRWGRMSESNGEDPYLSSRMAEAVVHGLQDDKNTRVLACVKHFAAYGGAESGRDYNEVDMSLNKLFQEYLPPYKAAIDAGAVTLMTSFNTINFVPSAANYWLMTQVLKQDWGFKGMVVTDWDAVMELTHHAMTDDLAEAGVMAIKAGTDMEMTAGVWYNYLTDAVNTGKVPMSRIDDAVKRVLRAKWDAGLFRTDATGNFIAYQTDPALQEYTMTAASLAKATEAVEKSTVLLKNKGNVLPVTDKTKKVLVVGPLGDSAIDTLGGWHAQGEAAIVDGKVVTVFAGITSVYDAAAAGTVKYLPGTAGMDQHYSMADHQIAISAVLNEITSNTPDMVVSVFGESQNMSGESTSRSDLYPCCGQSELIQQIRDTIDGMTGGKPIHVGVLFAGRGMAIERELNNTDAMFHAWFPGTMGGAGLANLISGDATPSAKLPITMPRNAGQCPIYYGRLPTGRPYDKTLDQADIVDTSDPIHFTSRYIDVRTAPLFPFGYGLSYYPITYSTEMEVTPSEIILENADLADEITVKITISNAAAVSVDEIVQFYIHKLVATESRPVRELKGFQKVTVPAAASLDVTFTTTIGDLGYYSMKYKSVFNYEVVPINEPGDIEFFVGPCSDPDWDPNGDLAPEMSKGATKKIPVSSKPIPPTTTTALPTTTTLAETTEETSSQTTTVPEPVGPAVQDIDFLRNVVRRVVDSSSDIQGHSWLRDRKDIRVRLH